MTETQIADHDALRSFITERRIGRHLDSRARAFHRAVERLFHATDKPTYLAAQRRWTEVRRALRRYERVGGQPLNRTFMLYHLANAEQLWARIKLARLAAPTEGETNG